MSSIRFPTDFQVIYWPLFFFFKRSSNHLILHASWGWKTRDLKDSPIGRGVFFTWASGITPWAFNMDPKKWRFLEVGISFQQKFMTVHTFAPSILWRKCHIVHMYKSTSAFLCLHLLCSLGNLKGEIYIHRSPIIYPRGSWLMVYLV